MTRSSRELVAKGYVRAGLAERFELLIGLVLFPLLGGPERQDGPAHGGHAG